MAKTKAMEETPVVFGAENDTEAGAVLVDTETQEPSTDTDAPAEDDTTDAPATEETPADGETSEETPAEDEEASEGGYSQAPKLTPTTVVETGTIPQTDSSEFAYRVRHIMNGDIQDEEGKSMVADKMVNEAHIFQLHKPVINSFPETGAEYLETLDFKVSQ